MMGASWDDQPYVNETLLIGPLGGNRSRQLDRSLAVSSRRMLFAVSTKSPRSQRPRTGVPKLKQSELMEVAKVRPAVAIRPQATSALGWGPRPARHPARPFAHSVSQLALDREVRRHGFPCSAV